MNTKATALFAAFAALAGCGTPDPYPLRDLEEAERRFAAPRVVDARPGVEAILAKDELTLEDALAIADALNPQLESERKNIDLATAAIWEAKLYPNPSLRVEVEDFRSGGAFGDSKRTIGLSQPLPVSGRIGAATDVAAKEREIAAVRYVWRRREILSDVKRAFTEVLVARRNSDLARETRDIAKALRDAADERFKAQAVPEMELLKAAVALARTETDVKQAEKRTVVAIRALRALMGDADFPKDKFAGELAARFVLASFEALRGQITAAHPLLEEAAKAREAAQLQLALVRVGRIPDIDFEISAGLDADGKTIIQGGLQVPLPIFNRNQAKVMQAEVRIRQAELQMQSVRNDLVLRLTDAYRTLAAAQDRVSVYSDEILPKAQKALDQTNEGYRLGKFGYLDLLDAQRTLAEARIAFVAALEDLNLAAIELEKLTGTKVESIR